MPRKRPVVQGDQTIHLYISNKLLLSLSEQATHEQRSISAIVRRAVTKELMVCKALRAIEPAGG